VNVSSANETPPRLESVCDMMLIFLALVRADYTITLYPSSIVQKLSTTPVSDIGRCFCCRSSSAFTHLPSMRRYLFCDSATELVTPSTFSFINPFSSGVANQRFHLSTSANTYTIEACELLSFDFANATQTVTIKM
jgi:hypothetical protein